MKQQLLQQAEYCTEMGAAACTLLWGVSSSEEAVRAILGGVSGNRGCLQGAYTLHPSLPSLTQQFWNTLGVGDCNLVLWGYENQMPGEAFSPRRWVVLVAVVPPPDCGLALCVCN